MTEISQSEARQRSRRTSNVGELYAAPRNEILPNWSRCFSLVSVCCEDPVTVLYRNGQICRQGWMVEREEERGGEKVGVLYVHEVESDAPEILETSFTVGDACREHNPPTIHP